MTGQRGDLRGDATLDCEQSDLPECYFQASQHALAGQSQDAKEAYEKVLADTQDPRLRALVYNDIAALCAQAGDVRAARDKLLQAIDGDPICTVARANLQFLGGTVDRTPAENHRIRLAILSRCSKITCSFHFADATFPRDFMNPKRTSYFFPVPKRAVHLAQPGRW